MSAASLRARAISLIVRTIWGMEVTHEASTATGMAFTPWRMSRGKVCQLHLRIHDHQQGLHILLLRPNCRRGRGKIRLLSAGIGAWKLLLMPPLPWGWLLILGGCPWARFISFVCGSMANGASNVGQIHVDGGKFALGVAPVT